MAKTPSASQAEELRRLMQRLFRSFGALAAERTPCGKPLSIAHAHALMVMLRRGELSQQDLGVELGIDKSNVARLCAKMVEVGHVKQRQSEHDGRSRMVWLTQRGDRLAREVDAASSERFGALLAALPTAHRRPLLEALQHLVAAVDELPDASLDERTSR